MGGGRLKGHVSEGKLFIGVFIGVATQDHNRLGHRPASTTRPYLEPDTVDEVISKQNLHAIPAQSGVCKERVPRLGNDSGKVL